MNTKHSLRYLLDFRSPDLNFYRYYNAMILGRTISKEYNHWEEYISINLFNDAKEFIIQDIRDTYCNKPNQ